MLLRYSRTRSPTETKVWHNGNLLYSQELAHCGGQNSAARANEKFYKLTYPARVKLYVNSSGH
jgi:hypothetical protein